MDEALSHWLRVREPADVAARSEALTRAIADTTVPGEPLRLLDLGTGTGSNIRYLAERFRRPQRWLGIDRSVVLLAALPERITSWAAASGYETWTDDRHCSCAALTRCDIETQQGDLGTLNDHRIFAGRHI